MVSLLLVFACADPAAPAWAVQHGSIVPGSNGMTGTQTWEFFSESWSPESGDDAFICARAQTLAATVTTAPGCPACRAVYALTVTELDSDCADSLATDASFGGPDLFAIGEVDEALNAADPYPGQSFGWAVAYADEELTPVGYAYPESLEVGGTTPAGWAIDTVYTLWPAVAWEL